MLMRKAGLADVEALALDTLRVIPDRPISFEVFARLVRGHPNVERGGRPRDLLNVFGAERSAGASSQLLMTY